MMTIRTSVMLLAAAAMPLSLQAKPAKTTAPAAATATAQKPGALAAMALLPADADDFVALSLTPEVAACLGEFAESAAQLDGVALANGKGSAAAFSSFLPLVRAASALQTVEDDEEEIDNLTEALREHHVERLKNRKCSAKNGMLYLDLLTNLERIGDHAENIATSVDKKR